MSGRGSGGPAYPRPPTPPHTEHYGGGSGAFTVGDPGHPGMTLRDRAALGALEALCALGVYTLGKKDGRAEAELARACYQIADAFIAERESGS